MSSRAGGADYRGRNAPKSSGAASNRNNGAKGDAKGKAPAAAAGEKLKFSEVAKQEGWADVELIEGVERDIVDSKLTVTWDR